MWVVTDTAKGSTALHLRSSSKHCYQRTGLATGGTNRKKNPYECKDVKCYSLNCFVLTNHVMNMHPAGSVAAVWRIRLRDVNACACVGLRVDFPN